MKIHNYHLVELSPWPLLASVALFNFAINLISWLNHITIYNNAIFIVIALILFQWFRDIIRESLSGYHTHMVQNGLLIGFMLFLLSEVMLFFSFFWAFFHSSLAVNIELGSIWPPIGIISINCWNLPLLGSLILLSSGFIFTLAHHALILGNKSLTIINLLITVILGGLFINLQYMEYYYSTFTISDSVYGSVFYLTTGLHALHVIAGVIFITVSLIRIYFDNMTISHHLNFEYAGAYWHLVDIVWLIVFMIYYWWGGIA